MAACESVSKKAGVDKESLRRWVRRAQVNAGDRQGQTTSESKQVENLKREVRELTEANETLKATPIFFAGKLDPQRR